MLLLSLLACGEEQKNYEDFTSSDAVVDTSTDTNDEPASETGETGDTGVVNTDQYVQFLARDINCEELKKRTMTFTQMFPGGMSIDNNLNASFYSETFRFDLETEAMVGDSYQVVDSGMDIPKDCGFSLVLPEVDIENTGDTTNGIQLDFQDVMVDWGNGENPETLNVQWSFLYPATFTKPIVSCTSLDETDGLDFTDRVNCVTSFEKGSSPVPDETQNDPYLQEGEFYEWGSDIVLVYVKGSITGSFGDLGFQEGWNFAKLDQAELSVVEHIDSLDILKEIEIDTSIFETRNAAFISGAKDSDDWIYKPTLESNPEEIGDYDFLIGLAPYHWFGGDTSLSVQNSIFTRSTWGLAVWGEPEAGAFLSDTEAADGNTYKQYYDHWNLYVDVAPFVPVIYDVRGENTLEAVFEPEDARFGAVCKADNKSVLLYLSPAKRPSEILWYRLLGKRAGWHSYIGIFGSEENWRFAQENTSITSNYTYKGFTIGNSCALPTEWK